MIYKINLMVKNANDFDNIKGLFESNIFRKCNALSVTLRDEVADVSKINYCRDLIKNNTSIFSNFRGNNLLTTATNLSLEALPEEALREVMKIYDKLKSEFSGSQYLILTAWVIYNAKERVTYDDAIRRMRKAYDIMKKNHFFLTGSDDYVAAAMIATTSNNVEETLEEIEECYNILKANGFWGNNNLQALSHILSLGNGSAKEKCEKVILLNKTLREKKIYIKNYALPLLGDITFVTNDFEDFSNKYMMTIKELKSHSGFGTFSLNCEVRNMIAASLVCSKYLDELKVMDINNDKILETTNNTALTIVIAMQAATAAACASAAAAASASSN